MWFWNEQLDFQDLIASWCSSFLVIRRKEKSPSKGIYSSSVMGVVQRTIWYLSIGN